MKSGNLTVSDARLKKAFTDLQKNINDGSTERKIKKATEDVKLKTGIVTRYYMDLNKAQVKLDDSQKTVTCRVLQSFCNELITKYTPEGDYDYDETNGAGYVIPRSRMECVVLPTMDNNRKTDYFLIGYFNSDDVPDPISAPSMGNVKLSYVSAVDEYLVQFGANGFNTISNHLNQYTGVDSEYKKPIDDLASNETLKKDYYTREEVDKLLEDLKEQLTGDTE
ncbi:hypothetical protein [Methanobrevibacter intestini]|jgi:hypothetical protein|uniref:hypothetical protein n=1 Tax=Methanobrevibacter intestini TaxID=2911853 RepID=UPI003D085A89